MHECMLSCVRLCDPMDCSPPGASVSRIFQARMLEWVAISFSRGSSQPRGQTWVSCVSCIDRRVLYKYCSHSASAREFCSWCCHGQHTSRDSLVPAQPSFPLHEGLQMALECQGFQTPLQLLACGHQSHNPNFLRSCLAFSLKGRSDSLIRCARISFHREPLFLATCCSSEAETLVLRL